MHTGELPDSCHLLQEKKKKKDCLKPEVSLEAARGSLKRRGVEGRSPLSSLPCLALPFWFSSSLRSVQVAPAWKRAGRSLGTEGPDPAQGGAESAPPVPGVRGVRTKREPGSRCGEEADPEADSHGGGMLLLTAAPRGAVPAPCGPAGEI